jgi:hypothetical protein
MSQHEHGEDDEMQSSQGFGKTLVVTRQAAEAIDRTEAAFPPS